MNLFFVHVSILNSLFRVCFDHSPITDLGSTRQGNIQFRHLVAKYKKEYLCAKKFVKRNLVSQIVHFVRQGRGRFLQRDSGNGMYYEIGDERAYAKLSQTMREGTSVASICREFASKDDQFVQQMMNLNQKINVKNKNLGAGPKTVPKPPPSAPTASMSLAPAPAPTVETAAFPQPQERQSPSGSPLKSLPFRKRWS